MSIAPWRAVLRLARLDARRHLARTILSVLLIALPIAALVGFLGFSASSAPSSERALATIPKGAQATVTAAALPRDGSSFPQIPEGAPGPWIDDAQTVPASTAEIAALLAPGSQLLEQWTSPDLIASAELGLAPGEQRAAGEGADRLSIIDLSRLATVRLEEAVPEALPLVAPKPVEGALPRSTDEVLVSRALAERIGIRVGDTLGFLAAPDTGWRSLEGNTAAAMQNSERGYRVAGIAEGDTERAWAPADWLSGLVSAHPEGIQRHWIVVGDEPVTWAQAKQLNALQAFAVSRHVLTHYPSPSELYPVPLDSAAAMEGAIGVLIAATVGALLVLFLVTPAFAVSAEQARRALGLAAAAGAGPRDLRRIILSQGLVLGALGGVLGAVLGFGASVVFTGWIAGQTSYLSGPSTSLSGMLSHYPWWALPVGVLLALGLGAIAALPPARSAGRLAPVDALRDRRTERAPRRRGHRLVALLLGPVLLVLAVCAGVLALMLPVPQYPSGFDSGMVAPGTPPPGSWVLQLLLALAFAFAVAGLGLSMRAVVAWLGRRGRRSRPALRVAMRDAADHPSRTVPAALGVLFALLAASYLIVTTASGVSNMRDNSSEIVRGTAAIGAKVAVSADFDRLVTAAAVKEAQRHFPAVTGSASVTSPTFDSSMHLAPLSPADKTCPPGEGVHVSSALDPHAPLRCASEMSSARFSGGLSFPSWLGSNTELMSGEAMRATRLPGSAHAAEVLERGGVAVGNAALLDANGDVRVAVGSEFLPTEADAARVVTLPGAFVRGLGDAFVTSPEIARGLGVDHVDYLGEVLVTSEPMPWGDLKRLNDLLVERSSLPWVGIAGDPDPFGGNPVSWAPILFLAGVAIAATAVSVLLSATQGRRDAATMHAVGAGRRTLLGVGLANAGVILGLGAPLGLLSGIALGVYQIAWNRRLEASGAWLQTVPVWGLQLAIVACVVAAGLVAALLLARPPRSLVRRALD